VIKGQTESLPNFFLLDEKPPMESAGKGRLRQQENCILRGAKGKFCGTNWTTHHFDAAANWIEGEFSSILRLMLRLRSAKRLSQAAG
jgi:hypothetical protein